VIAASALKLVSLLSPGQTLVADPPQPRRVPPPLIVTRVAARWRGWPPGARAAGVTPIGATLSITSRLRSSGSRPQLSARVRYGAGAAAIIARSIIRRRLSQFDQVGGSAVVAPEKLWRLLNPGRATIRSQRPEGQGPAGRSWHAADQRHFLSAEFAQLGAGPSRLALRQPVPALAAAFGAGGK